MLQREGASEGTRPQAPASAGPGRGRGPSVPSGLGSVEVRIADLPDGQLGLAEAGVIWVDVDAAGYGWFVDATPSDDAEFTTPGNQGEQNRMDLQTVLAHELGHLLGHEHAKDGVMAETLALGSRAVPTSGTPTGETALADALFAGEHPRRGRGRTRAACPGLRAG